MIDDRTAVLNLPLPNQANDLSDDVGRLRTSLSALDGAVITASVAHAAGSKATPVDADEMLVLDSVTSFSLKRLTWANLKATAKTYYDSLYAPTAKGVTNGDTHDHLGGDGGQIAFSSLSGTPTYKTVGGVALVGSGDIGTIGVAYGGTGAVNATNANALSNRGRVLRETAGGTMAVGAIYNIYCGGGPITMYLPTYANSTVGDTIEITNLHHTWLANNFTIGIQTQLLLNHLAENLICNINVGGITLKCSWKDGSSAWWNVT